VLIEGACCASFRMAPGSKEPRGALTRTRFGAGSPTVILESPSNLSIQRREGDVFEGVSDVGEQRSLASPIVD
jgi:hypothetical protein